MLWESTGKTKIATYVLAQWRCLENSTIAFIAVLLLPVLPSNPKSKIQKAHLYDDLFQNWGQCQRLTFTNLGKCQHVSSDNIESRLGRRIVQVQMKMICSSIRNLLWMNPSPPKKRKQRWRPFATWNRPKNLPSKWYVIQLGELHQCRLHHVAHYLHVLWFYCQYQKHGSRSRRANEMNGRKSDITGISTKGTGGIQGKIDFWTVTKGTASNTPKRKASSLSHGANAGKNQKRSTKSNIQDYVQPIGSQTKGWACKTCTFLNTKPLALACGVCGSTKE